MKCQNCKNKEATFFYEENINGKKKSVSLCADCAAKLHMTEKFEMPALASPFSVFGNDLGNFFDGFFSLSPHVAAPKGKVCPGCGATFEDIAASGKACCPQCYTTFADELLPSLRSLHGDVQHKGRVPLVDRAAKEKENKLASLRENLKNAIESEDFESAAKLRDEIRALEKEEDK